MEVTHAAYLKDDATGKKKRTGSKTVQQEEKLLAKARIAELKELYRGNGLTPMTEEDILALLLSYCTAAQEALPLAAELLQEMTSLQRVLEAPIPLLTQQYGLSSTAAIFLKLAAFGGRRYEGLYRLRPNAVLQDLGELPQILRDVFIGRQTEILLFLCLDAHGRVLEHKHFTSAARDSLYVNPFALVNLGLMFSTATVILAHNHPGTSPAPSEEDILFTHKLKHLLTSHSIKLWDHCIFSHSLYYSMEKSSAFSLPVAESSDMPQEGYPFVFPD